MTGFRTRREVIRGVGAGIAAGVAVNTSPARGAAAAREHANSLVYDVRDFGAIGDGVTDDTAAIQAAVDAATDGGTVYLPVPANFQPYVVSTLRMRDRVRVAGETPNVVIRKLAGSGGPVICANQAGGRGGFATQFRDLIIDGNAAACPQGTDGLGQHPDDPDGEGYHGDGVQIDNVTFQSCRRHGLSLGHSLSNTTLPLLRNVRSTYNRGRGVVLRSLSDGWFDTGWVAENGLGGVLVSTCGALRVRAIQIEGNDDPAATAWMNDVRPGLEIAGSGIVFVNGGCTFSSTRTGILLTGECTDIDISGNWFNGNNSHGRAGADANIRVAAGRSRMRGVSVHDNTFSDRDHAIVGGDAVSNVRHHVQVDIAQGGSYDGVLVSNNIFRRRDSNPTGPAYAGATKGVAVERNVGGPSTTVLTAKTARVDAPSTVPFHVVAVDAGRQHSATHRSRVSVAGAAVLRISASGSWKADDELQGEFIVVQKNGSVELLRLMPLLGHDGVASFSGTVIAPVKAGDYVELFVAPADDREITLTNVTFSVEPL